MPRISRCSCSSIFIHIMVQGINKEYIFQKRREKVKYIKLLNETKTKIKSIQIISYVIMDNHAHILICSKNTQDISDFMKRINEKYAMYYNFTNDRVGVVFRNRFKTQEILSIKHLYNCIKYIYNNPVKANIVKKIRDYQYSNYKQFKKENILNKILKNKESNMFDLDDKEMPNKEFFVDTEEDIRIYVKDLLNEYLRNRQCDEKEKLKEILCRIKNEIDVSYSILAEILDLPKTTIFNIMQNKSNRGKKRKC